MSALIVVLLGVQLAADTVTLDVAAALERGLDASPAIASARYRATAASEMAARARAWPNPTLGISAENLGQQREFTGLTGTAGLEGQAVLTAPVPLGSQRSGPIGVGVAQERLAVAESETSVRRAAAELLGAIGVFLRDQELARTAREELATLTRIATDLALRAEAGRSARGDAARAQLARGVASTRLARREAALGVGGAELARLLGYPASTELRILSPACTAPLAPVGAGSLDPPELVAARARVEVAAASVDAARGVRLPIVIPEVGVRRTAGNTGLYVGLQSSLPFFDRGSRSIAAARAEESAAITEARDAEEQWAAATAGARRTLEALTRAGSGFDAGWFESLEQTVVAAEARFDLGESTLAQLLDSRRARLQALEDYVMWQTEWWSARTILARLEGAEISAVIICRDPFRGGQT